MSIKLMSAIWENSEASGAELLVLLVLADSANDDGCCYPSLETIAKKARISRRYVIEIINGLKEKELIVVRHRQNEKHNGFGSNIYWVKTPEAKPVPGEPQFTTLVNPSSLPSEPQFTTPSEPQITRVVNPSSLKPLINHQSEPSIEPSINQKKAPQIFSESAVAVGVFASVTGMIAIPGRSDEKENVMGKLLTLLAQKGQKELTDYLRPFWQAWIGRGYAKTNCAWLDWAIAGEAPQPRTGSTPNATRADDSLTVDELMRRRALGVAA